MDATLERARLLYRERRIRTRHFASGVFAEPAWDILLDLYIAGGEGRTISVSSACIAASVPPTTALRTIKVLTDLALIVRNPHPSDARSSLVSLTPSARGALDAYLAEIAAPLCIAARAPLPA